MTGHIRWEGDGLSGNHVGRVGTLAWPAFRIYGPDAAHDNWMLAIQLSSADGRLRYGDDPDKLKAEAEQWLAGFVAALGAIFPDAAAADLRFRADETESYADGGAEGRHDRSMFATGMRRSADLIERGDIPAEPLPPHPEEETGK